MSFQTHEHIIPCHYSPAHIAQSVIGAYSKKLSIKRYTPKSNPSPGPGDITIIGGHANGFVKELYEPLWEDLEQLLLKQGRKIRSIWFADISNQGASGLLNEDHKYEQVSWYDHSRDLLHMVDHFRSEMPQPIIGFGHSMGANQLLMLSLAHPTLFTSLILMEPIIAEAAMIQAGFQIASGTLRRRMEWPTRIGAEKTFAMVFKAWDPRALSRFNQFALYPYPNSEGQDKPVRLTTGRFQELTGFLRPTFINSGNVQEDDMEWAMEAMTANSLIDYVSCTVLYICGDQSVSAGLEIRKDWLARTGLLGERKKGVERRVEAAVVKNTGHLVPFEDPMSCAKAAAKWIEEEIERWSQEVVHFKRTWGGLTKIEKEEMAEAWMKGLKAKM